jgi:uncharacterized protein YbjT (DUF2867 family)
MYAVTGITGKVGAAVARGVISADHLVRAVVRDRSISNEFLCGAAFISDR